MIFITWVAAMSVFCHNSQAPLFYLSFIRTLLPSWWNPNKNTRKKIFAYAHGPCWFQWVPGFQMLWTPLFTAASAPMYEKACKMRCLKQHGYNRNSFASSNFERICCQKKAKKEMQWARWLLRRSSDLAEVFTAITVFSWNSQDRREEATLQPFAGQ